MGLRERGCLRATAGRRAAHLDAATPKPQPRGRGRKCICPLTPPAYLSAVEPKWKARQAKEAQTVQVTEGSFPGYRVKKSQEYIWMGE
jgi:hypothetical protein